MLRCSVDIQSAFAGSALRLDVGARAVAHPLEQRGRGVVRVHSPCMRIQGSEP
jgi:hypothetical protein